MGLQFSPKGMIQGGFPEPSTIPTNSVRTESAPVRFNTQIDRRGTARQADCAAIFNYFLFSQTWWLT